MKSMPYCKYFNTTWRLLELHSKSMLKQNGHLVFTIAKSTCSKVAYAMLML